MSDTEDRFADIPENGGIRGFQPKFIDVDGIRTRYYDIGAGEPVVLLHGGRWSGRNNANTWAPVFEHLSRTFRVLAFDRIGCGLTDNPDNVEAYRFGTEIDHANAFLEMLDIDRCHLCGSSRGAGLAVRLAIESETNFETLVVTNSHTLGPPTGDRNHRAERLFRRDETSFDPFDPAYNRFLYTQVSHQTDHITEELCRTDAYLRSRPKACETAEIMSTQGNAFERTVDDHVVEFYRRIRDVGFSVPTLYVFGRNDMTVSLGTGIGAFERIGQANPNVRLEILNHCGHLPFREHPMEFSSIATGFIDRWR